MERGEAKGWLGKSEGKLSMGRPRLRWNNNIKMNLQEVGCGGMEWFELVDDRNSWRALGNAGIKLRVT